MKGYHHKEKGIGILFDDIYLVNGMRTPFGRYCGTLSHVSPTDLGIFASRAALEKSGIASSDISQVIVANIGQSSCDSYFIPRHIGLFAGVPESVPALMVQRICGSGFEVLVTAAEQISLGKGRAVLCTGTENMSLAPTVSFGNRMGYSLGKPQFWDMLWEALDDTAAGYPMGYTAENVAKKYDITRKDADEFASLSFERALAATTRGFFLEEIAPVSNRVFEAPGLKPRKLVLPRSKPLLDCDEHVRPTTQEALAKLPPVFSEVGVLTAGNSSGIVDGAASAIVASGDMVRSGNYAVLAKIVAAATSAIDPKFMGLAPVPAIRLLLELTGLNKDQIGLFEINEAFSAQLIGCERELQLDRGRLNVNGGAIAIGHPLAASGTRISLCISRELRARKLKYGIATACIGGGQATAILFENVTL